MRHVIYFARCEATGLVKVGRTRQLKARLKQLTYQERSPVRLIFSVRTWWPHVDEGLVHSELRAQLARDREWFSASMAQLRRARKELYKMLHIRRDAGIKPAVYGIDFGYGSRQRDVRKRA